MPPNRLVKKCHEMMITHDMSGQFNWIGRVRTFFVST